jgi:RNA-directed DNA polymerase
LLSNIVLDELDKELDRRGLRFVRYADDCNIYVKSRRSGERVMASINRFIERRLRLEVNTEKSAVAELHERHFLGFSLKRKADGQAEINLSERSKKRLRERVKELTPRNRGSSLDYSITKLNAYLQGWAGFFGLCTEDVERFLVSVDAHVRRRLRAMVLKHWKRKRTILRRLVKMGARKERAGKQIYSGSRSLWYLSHIPAVDRALNNAYWRERGLQSVEGLWRNSTLRTILSAPEQMTLCFG